MSEPKILYLCKYHKDPHYCKHTSRIEDALNFSEVGGLYVENEIRKFDWIPVTYRAMTEEEEKDACERLGVDHLEDYEKRMFTCQLPEDGQEILISTHWGVSLDTCDIDPDYGYGLENNGDWDGVLAWMPLPEPYKKEGEA